MQVITLQTPADLTALQAERQRCWSQPVLALGNFDGVHRGHQEIIKSCVAAAQHRHGTSLVMTFDPHPAEVLRPGVAFDRLQTLQQKIEIIEQMGCEVLLVRHFDQAFSQISYEAFFESYLQQVLQVRALRIGCRFAFGQGRRGDLQELQRLCQASGVDLQVLPEFRWQGAEVSSSRIRRLLRDGDLHAAQDLLSRPYAVRGQVEAGARRGRTIGFPTANVHLTVPCLVPQGVYVCEVRWIGKSQQFCGVANFGVRPTFANSGPQQAEVLEVHLFGFGSDIYGEALEVRFLSHLRSEKKFTGPEELRAQIAQDINQAQEWLRKSGLIN